MVELGNGYTLEQVKARMRETGNCLLVMPIGCGRFTVLVVDGAAVTLKASDVYAAADAV